MQLDLEQQPTLLQTLKQKLIFGVSLVILLAVTFIVLLNTPLKNFIRNYKPLPTAELRHPQQ